MQNGEGDENRGNRNRRNAVVGPKAGVRKAGECAQEPNLTSVSADLEGSVGEGDGNLKEEITQWKPDSCHDGNDEKLDSTTEEESISAAELPTERQFQLRETRLRQTKHHISSKGTITTTSQNGRAYFGLTVSDFECDE